MSAGREHLNEDLEAFGLKMQEFHDCRGQRAGGPPLGDAEMRGQGGVVIVAIRHADGTMGPQPRQRLSAGSRGHDFRAGTQRSRAEHRPKRPATATSMFRGAGM